MTAVLVVSTLSGCGACEIYKRSEHSKLLKMIHESNLPITVEMITYSSFDRAREELPIGLNPQVRDYAAWFPTFALFPQALLNDDREQLEGVVLGGKVVRHDGQLTIVRQEPTFDPKVVYEWLVKKINKPLFIDQEMIHHQQFAVKVKKGNRKA